MLTIQSSTQDFLDYINTELTVATSSAAHPFHQFSFGTVNGLELEQRMVVLRRWVLKRQTIMFHTDFRSPKVDQIKNSSKTSVLFYSKDHKLQLRFRCQSHIHYQNRLTQFLFSKTSPSQRACYEYPQSPTDNLEYASKEAEMDANDDLSLVDPYKNFAVCVCNFDELDLLFLNYKSHIRIKYLWDKFGVMSAKFVVA